MSNIKDDDIVLIHSDHNLRIEDNKRHNILCCAKFPTNYDPNFIPQDVTLVNLLRYILNEIFNNNLEILENKYYYSHNNTYLLKKIDS